MPPCHAARSARATMPTQDCETPRPLSARDLQEDKSSPLSHPSAGSPLPLPSTRPSIPERENRPVPFESPPPNPPPASFVQTYPPTSAIHRPRPARKSHSLPAAASSEFP